MRILPHGPECCMLCVVSTERVVGIAMLHFDDVTSVNAQQHQLNVIPCGDNPITGLTISFWVSVVHHHCEDESGLIILDRVTPFVLI